jgi:hypothetical protein
MTFEDSEPSQIEICTDCFVLEANGQTDPDWTEEERQEYLDRVNDLGFMWTTCEMCGRSKLGGERFKGTIWIPKEKDENELL